MTLHFAKYQGLGNDFLLVEADAPLPPGLVAKLCDRRRGVGGDGVLALLPPREGGVAFMHVTNSDGSVAAMCGNGIRCLALHLARTRALPASFAVETDSGVKRCDLGRDADGRVTVEVEMGPGRWLGEERLALGGEALVAQRVTMGNPHAVVLGDASLDRAGRLGPLLSAAAPGGQNAGFAAVRAGGLDLTVFERGAGLTEACGTGACAAALAAVKLGLFPAGPVEVRLPGGALTVTVAPDLTGVRLRGPAEHVFDGQVDLDGLP